MANKKRLSPAILVIAVLLLVALARDFLANGRPLYCRIGGHTYWPGLRTVWLSPDYPFSDPLMDSIRINDLWKTFQYDAAVFAPIPFSPGEIVRRPPAELARPGALHPGLPGHFRHWLGTDDRGRDVAAGMVSGARIAVLTGTIAMMMALGIGLLLGALAGFYADDRLRIRRGRLWMIVPALPVAWFYAFIARQYAMQETGGLLASLGIFAGIILIFNALGWLVSKMPIGSKWIVLPADLLIMRLAEIFNSIPKLIIIIVVAALMPRDQSIWLIIVLIGAMGWTGVARMVRGDLLRVREMEYVTAARALGFSELRVLIRHALPNSLRATLIAFAIGGAEAILLESALTFLGFGGDEMRGKSWGSLLNSSRAFPLAWWISLPPGMAICIIVLSLNVIGETLSGQKKN